MRRLLWVFLAGTALVVLIAGCGDSKAGSDPLSPETQQGDNGGGTNTQPAADGTAQIAGPLLSEPNSLHIAFEYLREGSESMALDFTYHKPWDPNSGDLPDARGTIAEVNQYLGISLFVPEEDDRSMRLALRLPLVSVSKTVSLGKVIFEGITVRPGNNNDVIEAIFGGEAEGTLELSRFSTDPGSTVSGTINVVTIPAVRTRRGQDVDEGIISLSGTFTTAPIDFQQW